MFFANSLVLGIVFKVGDAHRTPPAEFKMQVAVELRADAELVETAKDCIRAGIVKRMDLMRAINERAKSGRRKAEQLLDKYTGTDPRHHHWNFTVQARGAKVYALLEPGEGSSATVGPTASVSQEAGHE
jgi:hypothetical protein